MWKVNSSYNSLYLCNPSQGICEPSGEFNRRYMGFRLDASTDDHPLVRMNYSASAEGESGFRNSCVGVSVRPNNHYSSANPQRYEYFVFPRQRVVIQQVAGDKPANRAVVQINPETPSASFRERSDDSVKSASGFRRLLTWFTQLLTSCFKTNK